MPARCQWLGASSVRGCSSVSRRLQWGSRGYLRLDRDHSCQGSDTLFAVSYILGIDIGGTKCAVCLARDGEIVEREGFATGGTPLDVLDRLAAMASVMAREDVIGVGVSCGGPLDADAGLIQSPPNLPAWDNIPAKQFLTDRLGLPVKLENDANATAVAEWKLGAGRGTRSMAFLTVGTGIGAGLILDERLYRGKRGLAGEVGHAVILPDGPECLCGKRGCLEALASGSAIGRAATARMGMPMTGREAVEAFLAGDPVASEIVIGAARYLGIGLANLLQTLDLERIILGTIAIHAGHRYLSVVKQTMIENSWPSINEGVEVVPCGLGDRAQDYAAISLWLE